MSDSIASIAVGLRQEATVTRSRVRGGFFLGMSIVLFAIVLVGFAPTLYLRPLFDVPEIPPYLFVHGAVLTGWYAWFVVQTLCVAAKRTDLHRRLGIIGVGLGVAVVVVSAMTSLRFGPRLAELGVDVEARLHLLSGVVWVNIEMLVCFSAFVSVAVALRHRRQVHKRLMLLASISLVVPALSRILDWPVWGFGNNVLVPLLCCLTLLPVALGLHDLQSHGSVHPVTLVGGVIVVACFVVSGFLMPNTEFGRSVVYGLYNFMR